jgi:hypothetical protein
MTLWLGGMNAIAALFVASNHAAPKAGRSIYISTIG